MNIKYIIAIMIIALIGFYFEFYHNKDRVIDDSYMEYVR
jgi:hypothetical protein